MIIPQALGRPLYAPIGQPIFNQPILAQPQPITRIDEIPGPPEASLPRALNFVADLSGCGYWRMLWPEQLLNAYQRVAITSSNLMLHDPNVFRAVKTVRIQRQAADHQVEYVKWLKELSRQFGFKLIYEIDDIVMYEDIPHYNAFRGGFADDKIRQNIINIINMCDEVTTTCQFMKTYYSEKTGHKNITVIPNYIPKWWAGKLYNEKNISNNFDKHRKKPRIMWAGAGAHFDVSNKVKQKDDFYELLNFIHNTVDKFQWVFFGGIPMTLLPLAQQGKIEFHQWVNLYDYPEKFSSLDPTILIAPLADNNFNKGKSDLKFIEGCVHGIPTICQDICTYSNALLKFKTVDNIKSHISELLDSKDYYQRMSRRHRQIGETRFLENHLDEYTELYTLPYGDSGRIKLNAIQKTAI